MKKTIVSRKQEYFAICSPGFEHILKDEVLDLPNTADVWTTTGGVGFSAPLDAVYLANLYLNTAHRVLLRMKQFSASSFPMLFDQIGRVEWELWIPDKGSYNFRVGAKASRLNMRPRIVATCIEAIQHRLSSLGLNATYDARASMLFALRIFDNQGYLSFDTSGDHLHKRGYKTFSVRAPIRETLASAILLHTRFYKYDLVVDPFCGSGTFLIEGARMSTGRPAGYARDFGFADALFFKEGKLDRLRQEQMHALRSSVKFVGYDIADESIHAARMNIQGAKVEDLVSIRQGDYRDIDFKDLSESHDRKLLVTNPPYGRRLRVVESVAERVVERLSGWTVAILSPNNLAVARTLSTSTRQMIANGELIVFSNGGIKTYFHTFDVD